MIQNYLNNSYLSAVSSFVKEEKISVEELRELIDEIEAQKDSALPLGSSKNQL